MNVVPSINFERSTMAFESSSIEPHRAKLVYKLPILFIILREILVLAALQGALFYAGCEKVNNCCNTITGVWYLCLAIIVLLILVSCNDILMSRCYFLGLPWSKTKVYIIHENDADDQCQLLAAFDDNNQLLDEELRPPPPPPYSMIDATFTSDSHFPLI